MNVSAYLFKDGYDSLVDYVKLVERVGRVGDVACPGDWRPGDHAHLSQQLAPVPRAVAGVCPASGPADPSAAESPPRGCRCCVHRSSSVRGSTPSAPKTIPDWLLRRSFPGGTIVVPSPDDPAQVELVIRSALPVVVGGATVGYVITDLPIGVDMAQRLEDATRVHAGAALLIADGSEKPVVTLGKTGDRQNDGTLTTLFGKSLMFLDYQDWEIGNAATRQRLTQLQAGTALSSPLRRAADRLWRPHARRMGGRDPAAIAVLFLTIEAVALGMGLALARSITSSIHELFMGTERVRHGDFTHRIDVSSNDQLGELAGSFNQMTGSIEGLLQTAAEKKRLEEELRIARVIQMSLLPTGPLDVPGLGITALCVPAREVGGDYYDFFRSLAAGSAC